MSYYGDYTEELFNKFREEAISAYIKAEGAEEAMDYAGKRLIKDVMEQVGLREGMKFELEGEMYLAGKPCVSYGKWEPALSCTPFTKKGTVSKVNTTYVFVAGIKEAKIIGDIK